VCALRGHEFGCDEDESMECSRCGALNVELDRAMRESMEDAMRSYYPGITEVNAKEREMGRPLSKAEHFAAVEEHYNGGAA
jgi:hypothetical protein